MKSVIWSIKEIVAILKERQANEFDGNLAVSGDRGNGKSTIINKIFKRFSQFKQNKHQVYSREDVIRLLSSQTYSLCWDDEAVNSGYKRDFQQSGQKELIKIITAYRDNFNILASAIPNFFSLDKDLRDLIFLHIHVIERGIAVIHMPLQGRLYSQDRWDTKYNAKVEEKWSKRAQKNPNFRPPYHKLTTFKGFLFFGDLTVKQKAFYKSIKKEKRRKAFDVEERPEEESFFDKLYRQLVDNKLTKEGLMQICQMEGKKYSSITSILNRMLKDGGIQDTVKVFLQHTSSGRNIHSNSSDEINTLVPSF